MSSDFSPDLLHELIAGAAIEHSRVRKLKGEGIYDRIDKKYSSPVEMNHDWHVGCTFYSSVFVRRGLKFEELSPECYQQLEDIWLDDVKKLMAYYKYRNEPSDSEEENYYSICKQIESQKGNGEGVTNKNLVNYLNRKYLNNGEFSFQKTASIELITRKRNRIFGNNGKYDVEDYVENFYNNIVLALKTNDESRILKVKNALENKSLINCFEACIFYTYLS